MNNQLFAGAAAVDITPATSLHLFGYPHVARNSTGVHDPLYSSALYLKSGGERHLFIGNDVIFVPKDLAGRARNRLASSTGIPASAICLSATHTHSGPDTVAYVSNAADHTVPPPDAAFLQQLEDGIVAAGEAAVKGAVAAEVAFAIADGSCVGGNRRHPGGPSIPEVPVWLVRQADSTALIGVMLIVSMHPTVLHEDSTLYSGDFPGLTRRRLQAVWQGLPVIYHTGACGNQSPRHVVKANTFAEAERLGYALADNVLEALAAPKFSAELTLGHGATSDRLPLRVFPGEAEAAAAVDTATARFERLKQTNPGSPETRTAETDLFGAQETLTLAQAVRRGLVDAAAAKCMPAEVQCFRLGDQRIAAFPGEVFVEFVLDLQAEFPKLHAITMANGELQGYLVTEDALAEGGYEASNALFKSPDGANILMDLAAELLCEPALEID